MYRSIIFILLILSATACEDHRINLAKEELEGTWTVYKYEVDAIDVTPTFTSIYSAYNISFDKVKNYTESYNYLGVTPVLVTGSYYFSESGKILTWSDENGSRVYNVLTLNDTAMTLDDYDADPSEVYYFERF